MIRNLIHAKLRQSDIWKNKKTPLIIPTFSLGLNQINSSPKPFINEESADAPQFSVQTLPENILKM